MSLPENHPPIHEHSNGTCPVAGQTHAFCPPQKEDIRSVCPALNTMANHGYIRRDGKNLSAGDIMTGLKGCYGLSSPLAAFLSYMGFVLLKRVSRVSLHEIGKHNAIEHDASLVHHDTPDGETFAPEDVDPVLVEALFNDVHPAQADLQPGEQLLMNAEDLGRSRVRREAECRKIGSIAQEIARGEMAIIFGVWEQQSGKKTGIPVDWVRVWMTENRLPEGWKPNHIHGFKNVMQQSKAIKASANRIRMVQAAAASSKKDV